MTVRVESYPYDCSSLVKSMTTVLNGIASGFGYIGCNGAFVGLFMTLWYWHSTQPLT